MVLKYPKTSKFIEKKPIKRIKMNIHYLKLSIFYTTP